jgi:hypothetical protein
MLQLMVPSESAHDTVAALGDIGLLQFKDLNTEKSAFQRVFASQVNGSDLALARPHASSRLRHARPCTYLLYSLSSPIQVKRCDEMARKLRFLTDQVGFCIAE